MGKAGTASVGGSSYDPGQLEEAVSITYSGGAETQLMERGRKKPGELPAAVPHPGV